MCVYGNCVNVKVVFQIINERAEYLINGIYTVVNCMEKIVRLISHHTPNFFLGGLQILNLKSRTLKFF